MARYGVAWPLPHDEDIVNPKTVIFNGTPKCAFRLFHPGTYLPSMELAEAVLAAGMGRQPGEVG